MPSGRVRQHTNLLLVSAVVGAGLVAVSAYDYPLFHTVVEVFCTVIALAAFVLIWNTRRMLEHDYLLLLGIAFLFFGLLDIPHMLSYRGVELFEGFGSNLPTQLYIAQRYMLAASFLAAPLFVRRRLNVPVALAAYSAYALSVLLALFAWGVFPDAFVEGVGLTPFKVVSEYVISAVLLASIAVLFPQRRFLARRTFVLVVAATIALVVSEVAFTLYSSPFGTLNLIGHLSQVLVFAFVYLAIVRDGLVRPYSVLFRELSESEDRNRRVAETLQTAILEVPVTTQGVAVAHAYRSSSDIARIGGDFYDVFELHGDLVGFVLGDVSGKGLGAAATTMQVKSTIRAFAHDRPDPRSVLGRTNHVLYRDLDESQFVTAVYAVLDRRQGVVRLASAGHELPVVCRAGGCVLTEVPPNLPLGVAEDMEYEGIELRLSPGEGLVLYTDGVLDARRGAEPFGYERMRRTVEDADRPEARHVADLVLEAVLGFSGARLADDVAILGIEYVPGDDPRMG